MIRIILTIVFVILCIAMTVIVLMQEGKTSGLGAISGVAESYWGKNKGRSMEGNLEKFTKIAAILIFVLALVLNLKVIYSKMTNTLAAITSVQECFLFNRKFR